MAFPRHCAPRARGFGRQSRNPGSSVLLFVAGEHIAVPAARLDAAESTTRSSAAVGDRPRYSDIGEKESVTERTPIKSISHKLLATTRRTKPHPSPEKRGSQQPSTTGPKNQRSEHTAVWIGAAMRVFGSEAENPPISTANGQSTPMLHPELVR